MAERVIDVAGDTDLAEIINLLLAAGLPTEDLTSERPGQFLIARSADGHRISGAIGLEVYEKSGLLRSLIVTPNGRSAGLGAALVGALEGHAVDIGIEELWLLTIDAETYFARYGYTKVARQMAPEPIRASREFTELCPADAALMTKRLA